jgi:hypothetical protein
VGDHVSMTASNMATGFRKELVDPSNVLQSEAGALFFETRPRYLSIGNAQIQLLSGSEQRDLEQLFYDLGKRDPFFVSIDPDLEVSASLGELTSYQELLQHQFRYAGGFLMAFLQFPKQQYFRAVNTAEEAKLGYFNLGSGTELKFMMVTLFQCGIIATPYQIRMKIYGNDTLVDPIVTSDWVTISAATLLNGNDTTGVAYTNNWLGNVYIPFSGNPLNPNIDYYMTMETSGYTRIGDIFYLGVNLDWYSPTNNPLSATQAGGRVAILGKR